MSHPVDEYVGKRVRLRRTILGMSQEALGNIVGVTFQQIQKYERGANRIGSSRLFEFSNAMGVSVSYFFDGFEGISQDKAVGMADGAEKFQHEEISSRESMEIARYYSRISDPQVRRRVLELVKSIANEQKEPAGVQ